MPVYSCTLFLISYYLNIISYVFIMIGIFNVFFSFDSKIFNSMSDFKFFSNSNNLTFLILLFILSLSGLPPLLGFCSKFYLFSYLCITYNLYILIIFIIFNLIAMFFYLQNLRFLTNRKTKSVYIYKNSFPYISNSSFHTSILYSLVNILAVFFFDDIFSIITNIIQHV